MITGVPVSPRRIFGVDFSGANDAGRHTWICRAHPGRDGIRVESVDPLMDLPGGARGRQEALRSLVPKVLEAPRSAWGFDFPFALPMDVLKALVGGREGGGWDDQVRFVARLAWLQGLRPW